MRWNWARREVPRRAANAPQRWVVGAATWVGLFVLSSASVKGDVISRTPSCRLSEQLRGWGCRGGDRHGSHHHGCRSSYVGGVELCSMPRLMPVAYKVVGEPLPLCRGSYVGGVCLRASGTRANAKASAIGLSADSVFSDVVVGAATWVGLLHSLRVIPSAVSLPVVGAAMRAEFVLR